MRNVIIVEATSTGRYYAKDLVDRGYHPIILFPAFECEKNEYQSFRKSALPYLRQYTDDIIFLKRNDVQEVLSIVRSYSPIAVIAGSELGVYLADALSNALGLFGNSPQTSDARRNKFKMVEGLKKAGVPTIRSIVAESVQECLSQVRQWNSFPIVIKPLSSAGTQGVHFCETEDEIIEKFLEIRQAQDLFGANNNKVLVQEFARGTEFIVNTVSCNGRHAVTDMWEYDKIAIGNLGNAYNYAKLVRSFEPKHIAVMQYALDAIEALGFKYGPSHTEIMLTDRGPLLIETGARPMGGYFPPDVLDKALHHHIVDVSLDSYLDETRFSYFKDRNYRTFGSVMLKLFIAPKSAKLTSVPILALKRFIKSAGLADFSLAKVGQTLPKTVNLITAAGELILQADREADMLHDYHAIRAMEKENFNLLFTSEPIRVSPLCVVLEGKTPMTFSPNSWEEVIEFLGEISIKSSYATKVLVTTDDTFKRSIELLMGVLGWDKITAEEYIKR